LAGAAAAVEALAAGMLAGKGEPGGLTDPESETSTWTPAGCAAGALAAAVAGALAAALGAFAGASPPSSSLSSLSSRNFWKSAGPAALGFATASPAPFLPIPNLLRSSKREPNDVCLRAADFADAAVFAVAVALGAPADLPMGALPSDLLPIDPPAPVRKAEPPAAPRPSKSKPSDENGADLPGAPKSSGKE